MVANNFKIKDKIAFFDINLEALEKAAYTIVKVKKYQSSKRIVLISILLSIKTQSDLKYKQRLRKLILNT